jgi:Holliday junction resolvase RusA-like endonuclease
MLEPTYYLIEGINPEPWVAGTAYRRGHRGVGVAKSQALTDYQNAIAEAINDALADDHKPYTEELELQVWLWRCLDKYQTESGRWQTRHRADLTNMLKALEDALQARKAMPDFPGLIKNDVQIVVSQVSVVAQATDVHPMILLRLQNGAAQRERELQWAMTIVTEMRAKKLTRWTPTAEWNLEKHQKAAVATCSV